MKKKLGLFIVMMVLLTTPFFSIKYADARSEVYELELNRWGVFNDNTHAIETTKGINSALKWAKNNGYKTVKIPDGTYLIAKGSEDADPKVKN